MKKGKLYVHLLNDKDVQRWYDNVKRGSQITAEIYLRRLGNFCYLHKTTPQELIMMDDKRLYDLILDFVSLYENKGMAGSYIKSVLKPLKSWLSFNHREIKGQIKIRGADDTPSLRNERVPSQEELKRIFLSCDKKARVACSLMAHAGVRPEVIGDYYGKGGLCVGDLPELEIKQDKVIFNKIPAIVVIRSELSKTRNQYFTFLSEEGCSYVRDYLEGRIQSGEKIMTDSSIVTPKRQIKPFVRTTNVSDMIRDAFVKRDFDGDHTFSGAFLIPS